MKKWIFAIGLATAMLVTASTRAQVALGTSFTYQGELKDGSVVANGFFNISLQLFDASTGGAQIGPTQAFTSVAVLNGTFTVRPDFGAGVFAGDRRWVQVIVNGTPLTPRQEITATPYALYALNPGPPGPQGPSGVIRSASANGQVATTLAASNNNAWAFVGATTASTVSIAVGAGQTLHVDAGATIGIATGGAAKSFRYNVGYRVAGSGAAPVEFANAAYYEVKLLPGLRLPFVASYSKAGLAAGTYEVGLIVRAVGTDGTALNDNDWSQVHAWVSQP